MQTRYTNVSDVPLALAVFLASDNYDHNNDPYTISTTTLIKPLRQVVLPPRLPPGTGLVPLADMMANRMGAAIHDGIERAWKDNYKGAMQAMGLPKQVISRIAINPKPSELTEDTIPVYMEQRLSKTMGKWTITGKFDFVGEGRVQDFKSTSTFTYRKQTNADKYSQQGSIYRWLDPKMITQDEMDIHYIFKDWKASMAKADPNYPPRSFHRQSFPLMGIPETGQFIARRILDIEKYWDVDEPELPKCTDEELWRSEAVFKYYANPEKTLRSTKNFDSKQEAYTYLAEKNGKGIVKEQPGQVMACKYCPAFAICTQKDDLIASGDLVL